MLCNYCHKREATNSITVNFMGANHEVNLCEDCARKFLKYAYAEQPSGMWWLNRDEEKGIRDTVIPVADEDIAKQRHLKQLERRLEHAVAKEQYETAARLRDEIKSLKKEMFVCEQ